MDTSPQHVQFDNGLARASFLSASSLMGLQLFSRLFTFLLNQVMFRLASPQAYGTAAIHFELLMSTILFLSREGVRNAMLRSLPIRKDAAAPSDGVANVAFLPILIGLPLSAMASCVYASAAGYETRNQPHFNLAILIYAIAAIIELLSEPMHNRAMGEVQTGVRVKAEGLGITGKTLITSLMLWYDGNRDSGPGELALLAFATGQLAYGTIVLATYALHFRRVSWWPKRVGLSPELYNVADRQTLRLSLSMTSQSLFKHLLTEGDKFFLSWLSPLQDQGGYAIAVNYGSLIARIVFQPIEETLRIYFSKVLATQETSQREGAPDHIVPKQDRTQLQQASSAITSLLALQASFAIILVMFGSTYISIVLHLLLPPQYLATNAPNVLSAWIWYIPVLAVNGGLEAFVSSAATPADLTRQSRWMAVFSCTFIVTAVVLYGLEYGDISLVYANIINLTMRIAYSLSFIHSYFGARQAGDLLQWAVIIPKRRLIASLLLSYLIITYHEQNRSISSLVKLDGRYSLLSVPVVTHVMLGGALGLMCLTIWWLSSDHNLLSNRRTKTE